VSYDLVREERGRSEAILQADKNGDKPLRGLEHDGREYVPPWRLAEKN
jgi:hypothetical protein